jgi:hypothetical protein
MSVIVNVDCRVLLGEVAFFKLEKYFHFWVFVKGDCQLLVVAGVVAFSTKLEKLFSYLYNSLVGNNRFFFRLRGTFSDEWLFGLNTTPRHGRERFGVSSFTPTPGSPILL